MQILVLYFMLFLLLWIPDLSYSKTKPFDRLLLSTTQFDTVAEVPSIELNSDLVIKKLKALAERKRMGEKIIIVDPNKHTWKAFSENGKLVKSGLATAGNRWCGDIGRPCKTKSGVFHVYSLGSSNCVSKKFPVGIGGAPMPYCMYFNGGQGIHGSHEVVPGNISHGCVRVHVSDARWLRYNFVRVGTKVVIKPY